MGPLLLLKVSLLLAVTLVAARLLNRAPATARHGLWSLAFGSLLLLAPLAAWLPALHVPIPAGWESTAPPPPLTASTESGPLARREASPNASTEQWVATSTSVGPITNSPSDA